MNFHRFWKIRKFLIELFRENYGENSDLGHCFNREFSGKANELKKIFLGKFQEKLSRLKEWKT